MKRFSVIFPVLVVIFLWGINPPTCLAQFPTGFAAEEIAAGLDPTAMTQAPDGRIFLLEKSGRVRIVRDGALLSAPFLTLQVDNHNERGLSGIALDPDFDFNHYVYLFYTVPGANRNRVSRFVENGDYAVPGSETVLLETDVLAGSIHNAGAMRFGLDGKLYIATGDGADAGAAQRLNSLHGKILRINPDGSIPEDNPFYLQTTGAYRAIWALGLRNPFSFAMHPGTGMMLVGDVGGDQFEEVNLIEKGANYGWPIIEGPRSFQTPPDNYRDPLYAYSHSEGCAITGATFYAPQVPLFPERYRDKFFFGDYCESYIKVLDPATGQVEETFAVNANRPVSMLVSPQGELYYLSRAGLGGGSVQDNTSTTDGALWRVFYTGSGAPFVFAQPRYILLPVGEDAVFRVGAVGMAPLSYQWLRDGQPLAGANDPELTLPNVQLSDDGSRFRCRVSNADGMVESEEAELSVTANTRPLPQILFPEPGALYAAGDTLHFSGMATDAEDGDLTPDALEWRIDFHHDDHTHPALERTAGIASGSYVVPRVGETSHNVWYRTFLSATDSEGLSRTVFVDVLPRKTTFVVASDPPGITLNADGRNSPTPFAVTSVEGVFRNVSAPTQAMLGADLYSFETWAGGWPDPVFPFFAGTTDTVRALYRRLDMAIGNGSGLLGRYFERSPQDGFEGIPKLVRVDSIINFNWETGSPAPGIIRPDNFTASWTGEVLAPIDDLFSFHAISDDGIRLWVNDQLIVDQWVPQPETETTGQIALEGGKRYSIRMEYFELGGHAVARLWWSTPRIPKQPVPSSQLFPDGYLHPNRRYAVSLYPVPAEQSAELRINSWFSDDLEYLLYDMNGRALWRGRWDISAGLNRIPIDLANLPAGMYVLRLRGSYITGELLKLLKVGR